MVDQNRLTGVQTYLASLARGRICCIGDMAKLKDSDLRQVGLRRQICIRKTWSIKTGCLARRRVWRNSSRPYCPADQYCEKFQIDVGNLNEEMNN